VADRFDHLDGDQFVELSGEIALVLHQDRDATFETRFLDSLCRHLILFARDCGRRHATTVLASRMERETTPAGADFDDVIGRFEIEFATEPIQFFDRGFVQAGVLVREDAAGVHHRFIEKRLEHVVAKIVMGRDILLTPQFGVPRQLMSQIGERATEATERAIGSFGVIQVPGKEPQNRRQVVGTPLTLQVRFCKAEGSTKNRASIEPRIVNHHRDSVLRRIAKLQRAVGIQNVQRTTVGVSEISGESFAAPTVEDGDGCEFAGREFGGE